MHDFSFPFFTHWCIWWSVELLQQHLLSPWHIVSNLMHCLHVLSLQHLLLPCDKLCWKVCSLHGLLLLHQHHNSLLACWGVHVCVCACMCCVLLFLCQPVLTWNSAWLLVNYKATASCSFVNYVKYDYIENEWLCGLIVCCVCPSGYMRDGMIHWLM